MDTVFKALADPTRRSLLDELFTQDGQTLSSLERRLPMTRFGVPKHLRGGSRRQATIEDYGPSLANAEFRRLLQRRSGSAYLAWALLAGAR